MFPYNPEPLLDGSGDVGHALQGGNGAASA